MLILDYAKIWPYLEREMFGEHIMYDTSCRLIPHILSQHDEQHLVIHWLLLFGVCESVTNILRCNSWIGMQFITLYSL